MRKITSAGMLLFLFAVCLWTLGTDVRPKSVVEGRGAGPAIAASYHGGATKTAAVDPACGSCHPGAPHKADRRGSAFLNLHLGALDCLSCHAAGGGIVRRRNAVGVVETLAGGSSATAPKVQGRTHVLAGLDFVPRPTECRACHRRNSPFLNTAGLYDDYRRGLLEDLDVLGAWEPQR